MRTACTERLHIIWCQVYINDSQFVVFIDIKPAEIGAFADPDKAASYAVSYLQLASVERPNQAKQFRSDLAQPAFMALQKVAGIDLRLLLNNAGELREHGDGIEIFNQICMRPAFAIRLSYLGIQSGHRKKLRFCFDVLLHDHNRV